MQSRNYIKINMDMRLFTFFNGNTDIISQGPPENYESVFHFIAPENISEFKEGKYLVDYNDNRIEVLFRKANSIQDDLIESYGKGMFIGTPGLAKTELPLNVFTDNHAKYPSNYVQVKFPYRIDDWKKISDTKTSSEEIEVTGYPKIQDKVTCLIIVNKVLGQHLKSNYRITYDDVSAYCVQYFKEHKLMITGLFALTSQDAYKRHITDYYLKEFKETIEAAENAEQKVINSEDDLLQVVHVTVKQIKHLIENRRWIEAFWNGKRTVVTKDNRIDIPAEPKREIEIQPTLHILFHLLLSRHGIHVLRESDEGIGKLDFKFLYTIDNKVPVCTCAEFKLGHHREIEKGIKRQLPAYLIANESETGIFIIMWFKDEKGFFKKPKGQTKFGTIAWLTEAAKTPIAEGFNILTELIDASIKPSASK